MDANIEYKADGSRIEKGYGFYSKFQAIYDKDGKEISTEVTDSKSFPPVR
jgi:hypothetical protein